MSKIGRKPIELQGVEITINGNTVSYKGKKAAGTHELPSFIIPVISDDGKFLKLTCDNTSLKDANREWGLHRALFANKIKGASVGFEQKLTIVGLGYKGVVKGNNLELSLGFSHKIDFEIPKGIAIEVDKSGQNLVIKGTEKQEVGQVASTIRSFRPPEPYKGTGVRLADEVIIRKAGKTKA